MCVFHNFFEFLSCMWEETERILERLACTCTPPFLRDIPDCALDHIRFCCLVVLTAFQQEHVGRHPCGDQPGYAHHRRLLSSLAEALEHDLQRLQQGLHLRPFAHA
jgi:hypothetical protein